MEIEYLSDDDERGGATKGCQSSDGAFYYCDSIDSIDNYVKVESTVDDNIYQIINYPPLEKHSANKIVSICNEIDLIDFAIDNHVSKPIIKSIISPIIKSIDGTPIKLKTKSIRRLNRWNRRKK